MIILCTIGLRKETQKDVIFTPSWIWQKVLLLLFYCLRSEFISFSSSLSLSSTLLICVLSSRNLVFRFIFRNEPKTGIQLNLLLFLPQFSVSVSVSLAILSGSANFFLCHLWEPSHLLFYFTFFAWGFLSSERFLIFGN